MIIVWGFVLSPEDKDTVENRHENQNYIGGGWEDWCFQHSSMRTNQRFQ